MSMNISMLYDILPTWLVCVNLISPLLNFCIVYMYSYLSKDKAYEEKWWPCWMAEGLWVYKSKSYLYLLQLKNMISLIFMIAILTFEVTG